MTGLFMRYARLRLRQSTHVQIVFGRLPSSLSPACRPLAFEDVLTTNHISVQLGPLVSCEMEHIKCT